MKIAIHQPNLFPWLGYFQKVLESDTFVFLDHTINNRSESTYTRRVELINNQGNNFFITIPITKKHSNFLPLTEWEINTLTPGFPDKIKDTIFFAYKKHPYFDLVFPFIETFFDFSTTNSIVDKNIEFISSICNSLKINTKIERSSNLKVTKSKTDLLIEIVGKCQGSKYLSGKGGISYQDPEMFKEHNIELAIIEYKNFAYPQLNSKQQVIGLSIIDCLMNNGFEKTAELLK